MGRPRSSYFLWILGHVLRALFVLLIIGVCTLLVWRMAFSRRPPKDLRYLSTNDTLRAAYEANGGVLTLLEQPDQVKHTEAEDNYAYYHTEWCVWIKEADQIQLLFFYNDSTLERASETLALDSVLPRGEEVFDLALVQCLDVTPEGHTGDTPVIEEKIIRPVACEVGENSLYTFCKYTFDGAELTENTVVVYLDIYYEDTARTDLGTLRLYHRESRSTERALTAKEEKIIKES